MQDFKVLDVVVQSHRTPPPVLPVVGQYYPARSAQSVSATVRHASGGLVWFRLVETGWTGTRVFDKCWSAADFWQMFSREV